MESGKIKQPPRASRITFKILIGKRIFMKMSFAGHVFDMINRMKQNRALRSSKRPKYRDHFPSGPRAHGIKRPSHPPISHDELKEVNIEFQKRVRKERKRSLIIVLTVSFIVLSILSGLLYLLFS